MLTTLKNALKIKEIRKKLLYTLGMLVVIRLGSQLPVPGVNRDYFSYWFSSQSSEAFNFFDAFTGGSFENMSIFALNITPYITSSIIMQLLTIAIPKLEEMQKDGEDGRKKIASITRYVTVALALIQAAAMSIGFGRSGLLQEYNALNVITVIAALTAGSAFLMWVGERITENGIGNGISVVLVINIISRIPEDFFNLYQQFIKGKPIATGVLAAVIILAIVIAMFVLIVSRAFIIAKNSTDRLGGYICAGIGCLIALQVIINIAVVSGSIPPTGIPLPFVSAGTSSIVMFCASIGVINNVKKQSDGI